MEHTVPAGQVLARRSTSLAPRIVILGGGFAGVTTAIELAKGCAAVLPVHITLLSERNFFLFTPIPLSLVSDRSCEHASLRLLSSWNGDGVVRRSPARYYRGCFKRRQCPCHQIGPGRGSSTATKVATELRARGCIFRRVGGRGGGHFA